MLVTVVGISGMVLSLGGGAAQGGSSPRQVPTASCYEGSMGAGTRLRRVIVELSPPDSATAHLQFRPLRRIALATARPDQATAGRIQFAGADGATVVTVDSASETARFVTRTASDSTAVLLRRVGSSPDLSGVTGEWSTRVGPGGLVRLGARLAEGPCGLLVGTFDSPDQGQRDLPLTAGRVDRDSVVLEAGYLDLRVAFPRLGGDVRAARMTQNGVASEIEMRRGAPVLRRPQEPVRPFPYAEHEVRFASGDREHRAPLVGTLTIPSEPGPHPAVVLISGSGAQDRDETVAGHRPFLVLADRLTRLGFAVLRFDDRGSGGSAGGNATQVGLGEVAGDVRGAICHLRSRADIDRARIGLLGHSEGGYVAPLVAAADPTVAFVVLLASPAVGGRELLVAQRAALMRASGEPALHLRVDSLLFERIFSVLDTRPGDDRLEAELESSLAGWMSGLPPAERTVAARMFASRSAAEDSASVALWTSPWFKSFYHHDPRPALGALSVPVFAIIGELDLQVPAEPNLGAMESAFTGGRRTQLALHRAPGISHLLQRATTGRMEEYLEIEETISPDVLTLIERWLARTAPSVRDPGSSGPACPTPIPTTP